MSLSDLVKCLGAKRIGLAAAIVLVGLAARPAVAQVSLGSPGGPPRLELVAGAFDITPSRRKDAGIQGDFRGEYHFGDLLGSYYRRLVDSNPAVHMPAARAWSTYEGACSTLLPSPDTVAAFGEDRMALGLARIEAHYFGHEVIAPADDLVANVGRIRQLPGAIVQGRYDMVCPIVGADELARAWPEAEYIIVPDAGHSAMEPGIRSQLVAATERLKKKF